MKVLASRSADRRILNLALQTETILLGLKTTFSHRNRAINCRSVLTGQTAGMLTDRPPGVIPPSTVPAGCVSRDTASLG
jgi:hypothetical protein